MTQEKLIQEFLSGATEGASNGGQNLKIKTDKLIHFNTVIAERHGKKLVLNVSRYSIVTGRLQKIIRESVDDEHLIIAKRVPKDYQGSLLDFVDEKEDK